MNADRTVADAAAAFARAVELARLGPPVGPNPQVGCVIASADGTVLGEGYHRGAGTPHAEVAALMDARERHADVRGATAYVTLEPCSHTGRTGPCTDALSAAGIGAVVYAVADPGAASGGGGEILSARGIPATLVPDAAAEELTRRWASAIRRGRPYVIAKWAATLDGRTAAADGTSMWITGDEARAHVHAERARTDAIVIGTGTVAIDDPELSARPDGVEAGHQPLRVVVGDRDTTGARVWRDGNAMRLPGHDPVAALASLHDREVRTVIIEGGAQVTSAWLKAGVVDEVNAYIAPALLGDGPPAVSGLGIGTMAAALRGQDVTVTRLGADTLVTAVLSKGK